MALIGYWNFKGAPLQNVVADSAGSMDITHGGGGGAGWWRDDPDYAIFGNTNQWRFLVDVADIPDITSMSEVSWSFAVKMLSAGPIRQFFRLYSLGSPFSGWGIAIGANPFGTGTSDGEVRIWNASGSWEAFPSTFSTAAANDVFHSVVLNMENGGDAEIFIDGVSLGTVALQAFSQATGSGSVQWGVNYSYTDNIQYHDRVLTADEITAHAVLPRQWQDGDTLPDGLGTETGWWMPTYSEDNPNTPNIASSTVTQYNIVPTNIDSSDFVVDTDNGGEWAALSTYSTSVGHENRVVNGIKSQVFDTGGWTMTGWVKTVSPTNTQHLYDTDGGWVFRMQNGVFRLISSGSVNFTTTTSVPSNQWFHFAMSVDSSRTVYKFYLDGVLEETHTDGVFPTAGVDAIYIGAQQSGNYNINGRWDDFRLFDTQISDADVATLASSRGAGGSTPPSSVFYNPFKSQAFHTLIGQRIR